MEPPKNLNSEPYFVSWSGGKDSYLALHKTAQTCGPPRALLTMLIENGEASRSHGLRPEILEAQSRAIGVSISFHATSWDNYEETFLQCLREFKHEGITWGVFGDIKIDGDAAWSTHRSWADGICRQVNMKAHEPLWNTTVNELTSDFLAADINAIIVSVKDGILDKKYLGQRLTENLFDEFTRCNVHPLGERGEYHTLVIDAPLFSKPLNRELGATIYRDGYWFLEVSARAHHRYS